MTRAGKKAAEEEEGFKMNTTLLEKTDDQLTFVLSGSTVSFVNALRRIVLDSVPIMAVDTVEMRKNDSPLYDEMLAHRIGLVPLTTDLKAYKPRDVCSCAGEGCMSCEVKLTLKKKGPCNVYASDFESSDPHVKAAYPEMLLVKLFDEQELDLVAVAALGGGKQHAKHSAGYLTYRYVPTVKAKEGTDLAKIKDSLSVDIITGGKIDAKKVLMANMDHLSALFDSGDLMLEQSDTDFIITIESYGSLPPKEILQEAAKHLETKFHTLEQHL